MKNKTKVELLKLLELAKALIEEGDVIAFDPQPITREELRLMIKQGVREDAPKALARDFSLRQYAPEEPKHEADPFVKALDDMNESERYAAYRHDPDRFDKLVVEREKDLAVKRLLALYPESKDDIVEYVNWKYDRKPS